jgi:hypothetical protein
MYQGDQIGRIFAYWVTHHFGYFCKKYRNSTNNWATFSTVNLCIDFHKKMDWATFWTTFSPWYVCTYDCMNVQLMTESGAH